MLYLGDSSVVLNTLARESVDALIIDPPAGISFMGKSWDHDKGGRSEWIKWFSGIMKQAFDVMKPGAHGLVWALPRTSHWTATACEDAGFEIRDVVTHLQGQGFPKSLDIKKAGVKAGIACHCQIDVLHSHSEKMHGVREDVDAADEISGSAQQGVRQGMPVGAYEAPKEKEAKTGLHGLRCALHAQKQSCISESEAMQQRMLRYLEISEFGDSGSHGVDVKEGNSNREPSAQSGQEVFANGAKSGVEGRSYLQANEGQLHRTEVCSVPEGLHADGPEGRLHHGAPRSDGEAHGSNADANRSGPSQGPQYQEQLDRELGVVRDERGAQTCRRCGKARIPDGLGTSLKPATEFWVLVRKPCSEKTVAANVLKWGTGGINIDASRIGTRSTDPNVRISETKGRGFQDAYIGGKVKTVDNSPHGPPAQGRFPANLVLSHNEDCVEVGTAKVKGIQGGSRGGNRSLDYASHDGTETVAAFECTDSCPVAELDRQSAGNASRFFYCAKPSKREKNAGCGFNGHPTVKSLTLMRYLIRMITPPGGTVLDCFMGSGSTGVAAISSGFEFVGIEKEREYLEIAKARIEAVCPK